MKKLTIIGAGSMAEALISGLTKSTLIDNKNIWVTNNRNEKRLHFLHQQYSVSVSYQMKELLNEAEVIILAMKPKDIASALNKLKPYLTSNVLLISVVAGVSVKSIEALTEQQLAVVRAMPNTSAMIGKAATALTLNNYVTEVQTALAQNIFQTVGMTKIVTEEQLDAVTGLSGSGPAYIYYLVEAMEKSALEIGLDNQLATELIVQTLVGAAAMLTVSPKTPEQLRKEVTSPGGTTEAGLKILQAHQVQEAFVQCIKAATARSKAMGDEITARLETT
ncbi:pyrroline-5-carboxylate reductase [Bacillaceae bacterium Marseille-Q3522]|nr:pyrroline-5-carboxylate reductase [Bacillaceae bacterium Marseille-Q3522]